MAKVEDSGTRTTTFTYDQRGRRTHVNAPNTFDPAGPPGNTDYENITITVYNPDGTVQSVTGDQTYPVSYTYDYAGRRETMTTYGAETATTTWNYFIDTGLLHQKIYPDQKGTTYSYTRAGRLETRTWQRGIVTTYDYDDGGRLETTTYSDSTPTVSITYDALGRQLTQGNSVSTTTYAYNPSTLALDTETITTNGLTRVIDRSRDTLGRDQGWKMGTLAQYNANWQDGNQHPDHENAVAYHYSQTHGRLETISGGGLQPPAQFDYTYEPQSLHLINTLTGPAHSVTNTWSPTRNVLLAKENETLDSTPALISGYTYTVNQIGQRETLVTDGSAYSDTNRGWTWDYDALGQVISAENAADTTHHRAYDYDAIGNRLASVEGTLDLEDPSATTYTPNALNQYADITVGNASAVEPLHDDDGNLLEDHGLNLRGIGLEFTWDGENRLIAVHRASDEALIAEYEYDAQSRRVLRTTTAIAPQGAATTLYLYDGWNIIAEYQSSSPNPENFQLKTSLTWGIDLSGTLQGAGGVGGLLATHNHQLSTNYFPLYDANGNITQYLNDSGNVVVRFAYDPFGRITESWADTNHDIADFTYRFSTKPQDEETGFLYYGFRYYEPLTGRWLNRDPIEEIGGLNLYGFVGNDGINYFDLLGLQLAGVRPPPSPEGGPEWTCKSARKYLNDQVKKWENQYPAAAKILEKFLEGSGGHHDFSDDPDFVNEVKEKGKSRICSRISAEVCKNPNRGEVDVDLDRVDIRWNPSLPGFNAMFYAYGGALLSVNGTATVGGASIWNGDFNVTLRDTYVFVDNEGFKGRVSHSLGRAYRAGHFLQNNCKGQNPASQFSHKTSFSIECSGCCSIGHRPYEGPGFYGQ